MKKLKTTIIGMIVAIISMSTINAQNLNIQNVNVIDVENGIMRKGVDVFIQNGIITSIAKAKKSRRKKNPKSTITINGTGKFLLPGFVDTHAHMAMGPVGLSLIEGKPVLKMTLSEDLPEISARLLIDHGVTTARDPGGRTDRTVNIKRDLAAKKMIGPELFVAGSIIDTTTFENLVIGIRSKEEMVREIRNQKAEGVDFIKLYTSLNPAQIKTGIDEAHRLGLGTISHLHSTSWTEASNLGVDNIVHIIPGHGEYLPEKHRANYEQFAKLGAIGFYKWFEYVDLESSEIKELINTLKENKTSIDPTLVVFHAAFFGNTTTYKANDMLNELPNELIDNWKNVFNFNLGWTAQHFEEAQKVWPKVQKFLKKLHDAGILLTTGTDANNPWIVPGDSFHRELSLLTDCGLSNAEVLKIATLNGAKLLGIEDRIATVEEGKEADLVLLNSNPLDNIENSRDINLVIFNGQIAK